MLAKRLTLKTDVVPTSSHSIQFLMLVITLYIERNSTRGVLFGPIPGDFGNSSKLTTESQIEQMNFYRVDVSRNVHSPLQALDSAAA